MENASNVPYSSELGSQEELFLRRLIRKKARQIVSRGDALAADGTDLEQDLRLKVQKHLAAYSEDRGHLFAFLTAVVERQTANLVRRATAEKRVGRPTVSLSIQVEIEGGETAELADVISNREADARLQIQSRSVQEQVELALDVAAAVRQLTPDERRVAEALKRGTITDVARDLGIPRSTIYEMLARWREPFEDAGLREYL